MDEIQFRVWLTNRVDDEYLVNEIVSDSNKIKQVYASLVRMGGSLDHETWLEDLTSSARGEPYHQVLWVVSGMIGALVAYIEESGG